MTKKTVLKICGSIVFLALTSITINAGTEAYVYAGF